MPFAYFGRKGSLARRYPQPEHDVIMEPFAGSAAYSLHGENWQRHVFLTDTDERLVRLWEWLIEDATRKDFELLPAYQKGDAIGTGDPIYDTVRLLAASDNWHGKSVISSRMARDWESYRARLIRDVAKVKHWNVDLANYSELPDIEATWFIDPPYQKVKRGYRDTRDTLDFGALGAWTRARRGLTIACDTDDADWLPFTPLREIKTINNTKRTEMVWVNRSEA